ncbi:hypothetical protein [Thiothrix lacustris]|uniref:hypothetical protein n=1 Tax=Thiothrix lacustris TaxID=525917 RepID=UPI0027E59F1E|nr:hypothetical protein [Thiothrix lacustris]WMP19044.1 hypothetical protein RCS87_08260 [Thiothrix lacustris]
MAALPIAAILTHDYSLTEALSGIPIRVIAIQDGTHSDTYRQAMAVYVETVLQMLANKQP